MSVIRLKEGTKIVNFEIVQAIEYFNHLDMVLSKNKVIYWRHKVYPCAFIQNWNYRMLKKYLEVGYFYEVKKINKL